MDIRKLGCYEMVLKRDGGPALKSVQEEVRRLRKEPAMVDNSRVGDSHATGAAERPVQSIGEQVRVMTYGVGSRLGVKLKWSHAVACWPVEHSADVLNKHTDGSDGRTPYEPWKGKAMKQPTAEFGEKLHYKINLKRKQRGEKLDARWGEGCLGKFWMTGEASVGSQDGVRRVATFRRVGAHRRWDPDGLSEVRGRPWEWNPDGGVGPGDLLVRRLTEEENRESLCKMIGDEARIYRLQLRREDFLKHGFTEQCVGCQSRLRGPPRHGHSEACRERMQPLPRLRLEAKVERSGGEGKPDVCSASGASNVA